MGYCSIGFAIAETNSMSELKKFSGKFALYPHGTEPKKTTYFSKDVYWPKYDLAFKKTTGFWVMNQTNSRVIRRSAALEKVIKIIDIIIIIIIFTFYSSSMGMILNIMKLQLFQIHLLVILWDLFLRLFSHLYCSLLYVIFLKELLLKVVMVQTKRQEIKVGLNIMVSLSIRKRVKKKIFTMKNSRALASEFLKAKIFTMKNSRALASEFL